MTREAGDRARQLTTRLSGTVTEGGEPVSGGRVGAWQMRREEMNRPNAFIRRGRVVAAPGFEFRWSTVGPDGSFEIEGLSGGYRSSTWYLRYDEPGRPPTVVGPVAISKDDRELEVDIPIAEGGAVEGRVEHVPEAMSGQVWVALFDDGVIRHEALASPDGSFRIEGLPPGRYGLKAGHDAYEDPHVSRGNDPDPSEFNKPAEPWQGAEVVEVEPGETTRGVVVDFRPPGPLVEGE
jgi:hypothetical protein